MSADDRLPGGIPERNLDPPEPLSRWELPRAQPAHFTCCCGQPSWVFPAPGVGYCGMCPASVAARRST